MLSSTSPSTGGGDLVNVVSIERIIVLGLAGGPTGWRVSLTKPRSAPLDAHPGPILLEPGVPDNALVVRRPGIMAGIDWSIRFEHSSS